MKTFCCRLMLIHLEAYQIQSIISELLLLIGTCSINIARAALGVLGDVESCHLQQHTLLLMVSYTCLSLLSKHVKKNQLDTQLILSIFHQPLHVWGVSRPIIRRYNCMYTTVVLVGLELPIQPGQQTVI